MISIDGSLHSGSGTFLRYAAALTSLLSEPLHLFNIRAKRGKPGLRPQHLLALRACSALCSGRLEGDQVGSSEIHFWPGKHITGGDSKWDIGTAGSSTMLAFTLIPLALFADAPCRFSITGGLFQDNAPSAFHMERVLIPTIRKMGAEVRLLMQQPGYVPKGQGRLTLEVKPMKSRLTSIRMVEPRNIRAVFGISLDSHLQDARVSERMAERSQILLQSRGYIPGMEIRHDTSAVQKGAALLLWAELESGCLLGADQAGKPGRKSESIADFVVASLMEDIDSGATTDRHLADQLILFAALASGKTEYLIPRVTEHVKSNLWLVEEILGAKSQITGNHLKIQGVGFFPAAR